MKEKNILQLFPEEWRGFFRVTSKNQGKISEIRLRSGNPICIMINGQEKFLDAKGEFTGLRNQARVISIQEIRNITNHICRYSVYAYEDEMRQGFISVEGGHRIGICGQVVVDEAYRVRTIKFISSLNIRIAHEIVGAATPIMPWIYEQSKVINTVIVSPPGAGKTTLLRDMIRQVSNGCNFGNGVSVGVIDERSEIAGCFQGCPQNDVGIRTDVMDRCPKQEGMLLMIRSMAPAVVAIDELGGLEEWRSLKLVSNCGCSILATMHGDSLEDFVLRKNRFHGGEEEIFKRCIVLSKKEGRFGVFHIYGLEEGKWQCIYQGG